MADESGFRIASAYVEVEPDTSDFREKLQEQLDEAVAGVEASVPVGLDTSELDAGADDVKAKVDELNDLSATVTIGADDAELDDTLDDAKAKVDEFDGTEATATLRVDDDEVDEVVERASAKVDEFDDKEAEATLDADDAPFDAKMAAANAQLTAFQSRTASATIGGSGGGGGSTAVAAGGEGSEGSLLGALGLGVGSLMPGIGAGVAGMGLLGGTAISAFAGVSKALSAHEQATQNVGLTGAQLAATSFSNAVAVQQAQLSVSEAYKQAAENAEMSAEQQESAEMQLAETVRNAAQAQVQAEQAVTQAQQQSQEATFTLQTAQYNLADAWIQARYDLLQLKDAYQDEGASIQAAQVALEAAQYQQTLTDENAMSTYIDKAQAAVAVTQAQEQLTAAQQQATYTTQEYNLQEKQGVSGSQEVVQAREAVQEAIYGVRDAAEQMTDAETNLADTEKNNAAEIKQAVLAVTEAQQQGAYQQQQDALEVSQAQKNLTDTIKEQRLEWAATESTSNSALNQYEKDMSRLSAPAQRMVRELLSMSGAWREIERIAQTALAPGIDVFLKGIRGILPEIDTGVRRMGRAMGDAFGQFGQLMQSKAFSEGFSGLLNNGIQFADIVMPAFAQFLQMLGQTAGQKGTAAGLADLLAGIGQGLTGLVVGLRPAIPALDQLFEALGKITAAAGPALAQDIQLLATLLLPIAKILNSKIGGPFIDGFAQAGAAVLAFGGVLKLLPDFLSGPLAKFAKDALTDWWQPIKMAAGNIPRLLSKAWDLAGQGFTKVFGAGGLVEQGWSTFTSGLSAAGSAVASFVTTMGTRLAEAAVATGTWIAEHTVATATFIAENVSMAASATAAWIAENAATLGMATAIAALIAAVVWAGTHWSEVWGDMKSIALDLWHDVLDPMWVGIKAGAEQMYDDGIHPVFTAVQAAFSGLETAAEWLWHGVFDPVWQGIMTGVHGFESAFSSAWSRIESIFKTPVNFLIEQVYDRGIARFWNDIVEHVGLSSLKLPDIPALASGGIVPGTDHGYDSQLAVLRPGEGVLNPGATKAIGPGTVHQLNQTYGGSSSSSSSSSSSGGGHAGKEVRRIGERVVRRGAEHLLGMSGGGIIGDIGDAITDIGQGILSGAEIAADPEKAVTDVLDKVIGTSAAGDLGKVMTAIPKTLVSDLASLIGNFAGGSGSGKVPGGSSGAIGSLPENWHTIGSFLQSHGFTRYAAAGVTGNIQAESGGNPEILEVGGGGGGGLIQWTPYPPGYITGDVQKDLTTQLNAILAWGGGPGLVNKATSASNAALIYQDYYEKPASLTASLPERMAAANAVYQAMGWGTVGPTGGGAASRFDSGGWLMPNGMPGFNMTGQPEAVLTPEQSQALVKMAQSLPPAGGNGIGPTVVQQFYGTQYPTAEQKALMRRDLALALSGAGA